MASNNSRTPSGSATSNPHAPSTPSGLRRTYTASPDSLPSTSPSNSPYPDVSSSSAARETSPPRRPSHSRAPSETTALLRDALDREHAHEGPCSHGTFSPQPSSPTNGFSRSLNASLNGSRAPSPGASSESSLPILDSVVAYVAAKGAPDWRKRWAKRMRTKTMGRSSELAERHGVKDNAFMYLSYYFPALIWLRQYKLSFLKGDFIAALTIAGMYLPMALSLADTLAHVPPINGLYSFVFNPFLYAVLGTAPQMILGPEAPGSLLVGSVVKGSVDLGRGSDDDAVMHAQICGIIAGTAGATILLSGLFRLGFLDSVLSKPFLRGFISAIGFVIFVEQLMPELGLAQLAADHVGHGSTMDKLTFILTHTGDVHVLTAVISLVSFTIVMTCREMKKKLQPRYPGLVYIPDRLVVVVLSAILCYFLDWEEKGVAIMGEIKAASGHVFTFRWPFQLSHMTHIRDAMGTSFLIALLGFFESSVAAKSLGPSKDVPGIQLSPNRELVALGTANLIGACFMSMPAFGGYGRSKVNKQTGGKTPMSSVFLSCLAVICIFFILPYFYYLPKPVLSSLITVVAYSLVEEAPHDIAFFLRIGAWPELGLMFVIVLTTIFYSLNMGIAVGIGVSLLQVIRHATRPRIQILGRIPGTQRFENAEDNPERLEFVEGCLIVKIPEPLTFANTGELKTRLRRLEMYGTGKAHPALPRLRHEDSNRNIVFDIHGVTSLDGSGTMVLEEIVRTYRERGVRVFFSRCPNRGKANSKVWQLMVRSGIVDLVGGEGQFVDDVQDALKMTEVEDGGEAVVTGERGRTMAERDAGAE
ncbi:putative sulfate transporter [Diaporthe ampelina]|uniref:Putative sulfate transporter n=1 Tax=Diaporthe ampelina TaxID=1214573 RepID=A0A0G2FSI1_9PEZI|nr:putative sulfate transporter [Diaporthe ampelina]